MSIEHIVQYNIAAKNNFYHAVRNEVKQDQAQTGSLSIPDLAISLTPLSFVFIWAILLITLRSIRISWDNKKVFPVKDSHKVPCKNCRFFSNNHYVKCAVQPHIVLTDEAINCCEYSPKKSYFPPKNLFG